VNPPSSPLATDHHRRVGRDRLELLFALLQAPSFDPLYRADVIEMPAHHPVYGWACLVSECESAADGSGLCHGHQAQWRKAHKAARGDITRAQFVKTATPILTVIGAVPGLCRICPDRPAKSQHQRLCDRHLRRWHRARATTPAADFSQWLAAQTPFPGYGMCQITACPYLATSPAGLCRGHLHRYWRAGRPGNLRIPQHRPRSFGTNELTVPVLIDDKLAFQRWRSAQRPFYRNGVVNLTGLQPLVKAEIQWGMFAHAQTADPAHWACSALQHLAMLCRTGNITSLFDLADWSGEPRRLDGHRDQRVHMIVRTTIESLWCVYYSPADSRDAGFIETEHFGRRFKHRRSHFDLTGVSQTWLRGMVWDHLAAMLQSTRCPRTAGPFDQARRAVVELSAFLEADALTEVTTPACSGKSTRSGLSPTSGTGPGMAFDRWASTAPTASRPRSQRPPAGWCSTTSASSPTGHWKPGRRTASACAGTSSPLFREAGLTPSGPAARSPTTSPACCPTRTT